MCIIQGEHKVTHITSTPNTLEISGAIVYFWTYFPCPNKEIVVVILLTISSMLCHFVLIAYFLQQTYVDNWKVMLPIIWRAVKILEHPQCSKNQDHVINVLGCCIRLVTNSREWDYRRSKFCTTNICRVHADFKLSILLVMSTI